MSGWDLLFYFSVGVCYFAAGAVLVGWIRYGMKK